jgi:hypothetical protein
MQPVQAVDLQIFAGPASADAVAHARFVHAPPIPVQSSHARPAEPHVVTDPPPTQTPFEQHPPQVAGPHAGGASYWMSGSAPDS